MIVLETTKNDIHSLSDLWVSVNGNIMKASFCILHSYVAQLNVILSSMIGMHCISDVKKNEKYPITHKYVWLKIGKRIIEA